MVMSYDAIVNTIPTMTYEELLKLKSVLSDAINARISLKTASAVKKTDFTDTYPKGYFDLFGSDPTFFDEPEDIPMELDKIEEF